jgi:hypothetical protein
MPKKNKSPRNGFFLILGIFAYSLFFWITKNSNHVLNLILIGLACNILYKMDHRIPSEKEWINTKDIIYMCVGAILSSFMEGFPFNLLNRYF